MIFRWLKGSWGKSVGIDVQSFGGLEENGMFHCLNVRLSQQWNHLRVKSKGKREILSVDYMFSVLSTPEKQQKKHAGSVATGHGICEQDTLYEPKYS